MEAMGGRGDDDFEKEEKINQACFEGSNCGKIEGSLLYLFLVVIKQGINLYAIKEKIIR